MPVNNEYYSDGALKSMGVEENGVKEGTWVYYYENGKISQEINYSNGLENGEWKRWHRNGNLYLVQHKKKGQTVGIWKEYYEKGQIKEIGEYIDGEYFPSDFWDETGQQTLKNGTGKKIEKFGSLGLDVFEHYFEHGYFVREVKLSSAQYGKFVERGREGK